MTLVNNNIQQHSGRPLRAEREATQELRVAAFCMLYLNFQRIKYFLVHLNESGCFSNEMITITTVFTAIILEQRVSQPSTTLVMCVRCPCPSLSSEINYFTSSIGSSSSQLNWKNRYTSPGTTFSTYNLQALRPSHRRSVSDHIYHLGVAFSHLPTISFTLLQ